MKIAINLLSLLKCRMKNTEIINKTANMNIKQRSIHDVRRQMKKHQKS